MCIRDSGETTEAFVVQYEIKPAPMTAGTYRNITGNLALAYGLIAGSTQSDLPLFLGSYPITPASDILHELSKHKRFGVTTFQAEDEIAGIGAAERGTEGGADAGDLVLGLERGDAEALVLAQLVEDVGGRGDRVGPEEQRQVGLRGTGDQAVGQRQVAGDV